MSLGFLASVGKDLEKITSGEFSEPVVIAAGSLTWGVDGIFDETFLSVDENNMAIQSESPQLGIYITKIDSDYGRQLSEDDDMSVTVRGVTYYVSHIERDGAGYARLILKKN